MRTWAADGNLRATLVGHAGPVNAVAIAPGGSWLASAGQDGTVRTWAADGDLRARMNGHTGPAYSVAVSPDGCWLASTGRDGTMRTWAADGSQRSISLGHAGPVRAVSIAANGAWLATAGDDRMLRIWTVLAMAGNVRGGTAIRVDGAISTCAWLPDSTGLCFAGQLGIYLFSLRPPPD